MQNLDKWRLWAVKPSIWLMALLCIAASLAACGRSASDKPTLIPGQVSANTANQASEGNATLALQPASGYGGLYVQVSGDNWPQNMMVLVMLEDAQGRSETLAASDTDPAGNLTTGFLFPIDERWLASDSPWVVTTTADGSIEAKAKFTVVPPGSEVAMNSSSTSSSPSPLTSSGATVADSTAVTDTAETEQELAHKVNLPLVTSSGVERSANARAGRSSSSGVTQVDVDIEPRGSKSIDCRDGQEWITVVIFSAEHFDATSVDPGSVVVASGADLGFHGGSAETTFVALALPRPVQRNLPAYQWQWHLEDVDSDGTTDLVMEFRLDYTELTCDASVVAVTGRTKGGKRFEGTNHVDMLVLERG